MGSSSYAPTGMGPSYRGGPQPLTEVQLRFVDWLCGGDERLAGETQNAFARRIGVDSGTLTKWKKHPLLLDEWESRIRTTWGSPQKYNDLLEKLYERATDPDGGGDANKATELFLKAVDKMTPERLEVSDSRKVVEDLSDEDLVALGENVTALATRRDASG